MNTGESGRTVQKGISLLIPSLEPEKVRVGYAVGQIEILLSSVKGRAKARNALALRSQGSYLLFVDSDVELSREVVSHYIRPAYASNTVISYEGNNQKLCTRIFGIPRDLFFKIGGFDETFDLGEDLEIGYRLEKCGIKSEIIPKERVKHLKKETSFRWFVSYLIRARLSLRYHAYRLLLPVNRKNDVMGFPILVTAFYRYFFDNRRENVRS